MAGNGTVQEPTGSSNTGKEVIRWEGEGGGAGVPPVRGDGGRVSQPANIADSGVIDIDRFVNEGGRSARNLDFFNKFQSQFSALFGLRITGLFGIAVFASEEKPKNPLDDSDIYTNGGYPNFGWRAQLYPPSPFVEELLGESTPPNPDSDISKSTLQIG